VRERPMEANFECRLHDSSKLSLAWIRPGSLELKVFRPSVAKTGTVFFLAGTTVLQGEELERFVTAIAGKAGTHLHSSAAG